MTTQHTPVQPVAYCVYFPNDQRQDFCEDLDDLMDDLTNCRHEITPLYSNPQPVIAPEGWTLVPIEPTQEMIAAMSTSKAKDSEGEFPMLLDLIDYSGENKTCAVLKASYAAMLAAAPKPQPVIAPAWVKLTDDEVLEHDY
jgi:hypothetical protein